MNILDKICKIYLTALIISIVLLIIFAVSFVLWYIHPIICILNILFVGSMVYLTRNSKNTLL